MAKFAEFRNFDWECHTFQAIVITLFALTPSPSSTTLALLIGVVHNSGGHTSL
jgi:hypothetical protein